MSELRSEERTTMKCGAAFKKVRGRMITCALNSLWRTKVLLAVGIDGILLSCGFVGYVS